MFESKNSKKLLTVLLVIIFLCGFVAHMITTNGGRVKVETVTLDARGATETARLYYPVGTTDESNLPAIIVTHGAGVNSENMKNFSTELARRGFVVLGVNAYGAETSEFPANDEIGMGDDDYNARATPGGLHDAIEFVRNMKFVDQTRIGIMGHSQGSRRSCYAASIDAGYLTFNDIMINVLTDVFGQTISEEELQQNADDLASAKLDEQSLAFYNILREQNWNTYNTRVRSCLVVGGDAPFASPAQTVMVGGHEVQRNCQINLGLVIGTYDSYVGYPASEDTLNAYYRDQPIDLDTWYSLNDTAKNSTALGDFFTTDVRNDTALQDAVNARTLRMVTMPVETHSRNMLSKNSTSDAIRFFEQTLGYNCGNLSEGATGISYTNTIFMWREILGLISIIALLCAFVPFCALLLKTPFFAEIVQDNSSLALPATNKKQYWIINALMVIGGFFAIYKTNKVMAPFLPAIKLFPFFQNWYMALFYVLWMAGISVVIILVVSILEKKRTGHTASLKALNIRINGRTVWKTILLAAIAVGSAYILDSIQRYFLGETFQFWTVEFTNMKAEYWGYVITGAIIFVIPLMIMGLITNYGLRADTPVWLEDIICILVGVGGMYINWLVNCAYLSAGKGAFVNWNSSYGMLILLPLHTLLNRKLYRLTKSVWLGALLNALLIAWTMICINGYATYFGQGVISNFLNN